MNINIYGESSIRLSIVSRTQFSKDIGEFIFRMVDVLLPPSRRLWFICVYMCAHDISSLCTGNIKIEWPNDLANFGFLAFEMASWVINQQMSRVVMGVLCTMSWIQFINAICLVTYLCGKCRLVIHYYTCGRHVFDTYMARLVVTLVAEYSPISMSTYLQTRRNVWNSVGGSVTITI